MLIYFILEIAVVSLAEMPDDFMIKKFLLSNKAEVKGMFLTEYNQEKILEQERKYSFQQGINQTNERVAMTMLRKNYSLSAIEEISQLPKEIIMKIADTIGVSVI